MKRVIILIGIIFTLNNYAKENISLATRMYGNSRALAVGDLVTVIVKEESSSSKSEGMKTGKDASISVAEGVLGGAANSERWAKAHTIMPPLSVSGKSKFDGSGSASSTEALSAKYTVRIVDISPNKEMIIRGERLVEKNGEKVSMVLSGMIRTQDVTADNTINSDQISDARIHYTTSGQVSTGSRPGWLYKIIQILNPF